MVDHALHMLDRAAGSDLILFPEMWPCGYFSFDLYAADSEPLDGPLVAACAEKAQQLRAHILMGSFPECEEGRYYNTAVLLNPHGQLVARYRKIHLFSYQSEEHDRLSPGTEAVAVDTPFGKVGLAICYDLRFPEQFRHLVAQGVEMFLVASAWPAARLESWRLFNRVRATENLAYLISCNSAGVNRGQALAGHSMIVGPLGQVLAEGGDQEEIVTATIDLGLAARVREEFPALRDRVPF
jgi:predicted amidohydrolase